jgi:hypothetical protein
MKPYTLTRYRALVRQQRVEPLTLFQCPILAHRALCYFVLVYPGTRRSRSVMHAMGIPIHESGRGSSVLHMLWKEGAIDRIDRDCYRLGDALWQASSLPY